jgi:hypothetical protein
MRNAGQKNYGAILSWVRLQTRPSDGSLRFNGRLRRLPVLYGSGIVLRIPQSGRPPRALFLSGCVPACFRLPFEGVHTTCALRSLTQWLDSLIIPDQGTAILSSSIFSLARPLATVKAQKDRNGGKRSRSAMQYASSLLFDSQDHYLG